MKFHLLVVLGLVTVIKTKGTALGGRPEGAYQQELTETDYISNKLEDGSSRTTQVPFYYNNNFDCTKHQYAYGMYADMDFQCQVYHVCHNNRKETFLCPQGTLFNQRLLVCDHWHSVNCLDTPSFYFVNEALGRVSNRTRFDSTDGSYSRRRLPEDDGQHSPYSSSHTTAWQGQQFPSSYGRRTQLPFTLTTTEAPIDSFRIRDQFNYQNQLQSGRYYPQAPRDQTTTYRQPPVGRHFAPQDRQASGSPYDNRQQNFNYGEQQHKTGFRGSLHGDQQLPFNQLDNSTSGTQQNRGLVFTHYLQSGIQRTNRDERPNTWPFDQRNTTRGSQYGQHPTPSWRYGQNYPENSLLGLRYSGQKPPFFQQRQHVTDNTTPIPPYGHRQPAVLRDGRFHSQVLTSDSTYDRQQPSTALLGQTHSSERSPESFYNRGQTTNLENGQKPRFGISDSISGPPGPLSVTQVRQQPPQPGSSRPFHRPRHPFTTQGGQGQIHSDVTSDSTYRRSRPSQQPPHSQIPGYDQQQPSIVPQYGQQPDIGASRPSYGKQPSDTRRTQHQSALHFRQNQANTTPSGPLYNQQQPIIPDSRLGYPQTRQPEAYRPLQPSITNIGQRHQDESQSDAQRNRTQSYNQQTLATRFQIYQSQTSEKPGFGYVGQSLNRQSGGNRELGYGTEQNITSFYGGQKQGTQYGRHGGPQVPSDREPKDFQRSQSQQSRSSQRNQSFGNGQSQFGSQDLRPQYRYQEPVSIPGYSWQTPGSPQYSFQQPQYRNMYLSMNAAGPSHVAPTVLNNSYDFSGQPRDTNERSNIWNHQSGSNSNLRSRSTETVPVETQFEDELATKGSHNKNLKPILVYQHHTPGTVNGSTTTSGSYNRTESNRQQVPVYNVYYVKGSQKDGATN